MKLGLLSLLISITFFSHAQAQTIEERVVERVQNLLIAINTMTKTPVDHEDYRNFCALAGETLDAELYANLLFGDSTDPAVDEFKKLLPTIALSQVDNYRYLIKETTFAIGSNVKKTKKGYRVRGSLKSETFGEHAWTAFFKLQGDKILFSDVKIYGFSATKFLVKRLTGLSLGTDQVSSEMGLTLSLLGSSPFYCSIQD